ncbi:MAG: DUF4197 domain-containing protein [Flavobacteriales bacterium]
MKLFLLAIATTLLFSQCSEKGLQTLNDVLSTTNEVLGSDGTAALTNQDVISGLKEALRVGTDSAVGLASKTNGFYKNPLLFIEFPPEAIKVKNTLTDAGFGSLVEDFEMTLNRSAEEASRYAAPIFIDAITEMTIQDGFNILNGPDNAATNYLKEKTTSSLRAEFKPVVDEAIKKVNLTKFWEPVVSKYNLLTILSGGEQVNPDLEAYVTTNAMDGLFQHIEQEEKQIRENPQARVTELLQKVFGSVSQN